MFVLGLCLISNPFLPSFLPDCYKVSNFALRSYYPWCLCCCLLLGLVPSRWWSDVLYLTQWTHWYQRKQTGQTFQITLGLTGELGNRLCSYLLQTDSFVWPLSPGMWLTLDVLRIWNLAVISDLGRNKASRRANKFFPVGVYRSRFINLARVNSLLLFLILFHEICLKSCKSFITV